MELFFLPLWVNTACGMHTCFVYICLFSMLCTLLLYELSVIYLDSIVKGHLSFLQVLVIKNCSAAKKTFIHVFW